MGPSHHMMMKEKILRSPHLDLEVMGVAKTNQDLKN
jgi:hypothetical protein